MCVLVEGSKLVVGSKSPYVCPPRRKEVSVCLSSQEEESLCVCPRKGKHISL